MQAQIAQLTPEVILTQRKKKIIQMDNEVMKQKKMSLQERINLKNGKTNESLFFDLHGYLVSPL